jgi:hypothetical protein
MTALNPAARPEGIGNIGHAQLASSPLFRPVRNNRHGGRPAMGLSADGICQLTKFYGKKVGIGVDWAIHVRSG